MFSSRMLYLLFFVSGMSSLIFEVVWMRLLLRTMGANVFSTACVLAAFMAGLAAGGLLSSRRTVQERPLRSWALAEFLCGCIGALLPFLLTGDRIEQLAVFVPLDGLDWVSGAARFFLAFVVLLVPTTAMGTGYPLLLKYLRQQSERDHSKTLYAFNVTGAMLGALSGGFLLLPWLGVKCTSLIAAGMNATIFMFVFFQIQRQNSSAPLQTEIVSVSSSSSPAGPPGQAVEALVVLSGVGLMLLELCWTRIFSTAFGSSVYSSGTVFFLVLTGLACSAIIASRLRGRPPSLSLVMLSCGFVIALTSHLFGFLPAQLLNVTRVLVQSGLNQNETFILSRLLLAIPLVLPASVLAGLVFPLAVSGTSPAASRRLYIASCVGSALGAIAGGGILLPLLLAKMDQGIGACVVFSACIFTAGGIMFGIVRSGEKPKITGSALVAGLTLLCLIMPPGQNKGAFTSGVCYLDLKTMLEEKTSRFVPPDLEYYKEGLNATIALSTVGNTISLRTDGKVEATLPRDPLLIAPGCDLSTHALLGALPLVLNRKPDHALLIGYGSGITADAMLSFNLLQSLTVAELEPSVLEAAQLLKPFRAPFFPSSSAISPVFRINDGRYVLAATRQKWDVIACQTAEPRTAGAADLYTREFWQLVRSRLNEGGVCSQWVQLYAMPESELQVLVRTFRSVFPNAYICHVPGAGEIILIGMTGTDKIALKQINDRIQRANTNSTALSFSGITSGADLLSTFKVGPNTPPVCGPGKLNVDDSSALEFVCGLFLSAQEDLIAHNYDSLLKRASNPGKDLPFDFLLEAADKRLLSEVAVSLIRQSNSGAFGSVQDAALARVFASEALAVRSRQTLWNQALVLLKGSAATVTTLEALQQAPCSTSADHLAIAQCLFAAAVEGKGLPDVEKSLSLAASAPDYQRSIAEANLLAGWVALENNHQSNADSSFGNALQTRTGWAPALLGRLLSMRFADKGFANALGRALTTDPWNAANHFIATKYFLQRNDLELARLHAVNCAALSGSVDAFLLILARDPSALPSMLPLIERAASADVRLPELKRIASDRNAVQRFASQAESRISGNLVSGYNKLGFPW